MDIGNPRFVFTTQHDGKEEKPAQPIRFPAQAELVIDSLDRFHDPPGGLYSGQPISKVLNSLVSSQNPVSNFQIAVKRNLLYGYFHRLAITQLQMQLRLPTVITGINDQFILSKNASTGGVVLDVITVPQGYYTPTTLAAALQVLIRASLAGTAGYTVAYTPLTGGFTFATNTADTTCLYFANFPPSVGVSETQALVYYKFGRLIGAGRKAYGVQSETASPPTIAPLTSFATQSLNFWYTEYIDICSQTITRYKRVKDAASTDAGLQNIVARVYLNPPDTQAKYSAGDSPNSSPSVLTVEFKTPDAHKWSAEEALQNIDFQLYDMWGEPLYWSSENGTEFQMTLLASES
jgi:hypothetical protein